jgi:hypothetical protein
MTMHCVSNYVGKGLDLDLPEDLGEWRNFNVRIDREKNGESGESGGESGREENNGK